MPDPVESSNFRLEEVSLGFLRDFRPGQFLDSDSAPGATVSGFVQVVSAGGADDTGDAIN